MATKLRNLQIALAFASAALTATAHGEGWELPKTGYDLLAELQKTSMLVDTSQAGLDRYATNVAAHAYVIGVAEASGAGRCAPESTLQRDVWLIVRSFLEQNTSRLREKARDLVIAALQAAFPC